MIDVITIVIVVASLLLTRLIIKMGKKLEKSLLVSWINRQYMQLSIFDSIFDC